MGESHRTTSARRACAAGLGCALAALLAVAGTAPAAAASSGSARVAGKPAACTSAAHAMPARGGDTGRAAHALLCLVNRERARAGARRLRPNRCLARVAARHARDMIARGYFGHTSPDGRTFGERILATGYAPRYARWTIGENLAWGAAPDGDPAWVVDAWMRSPSHRQNLLRTSFRDVGVAAVSGAPLRSAVSVSAPRATYVVEFGVRAGGRGRCG